MIHLDNGLFCYGCRHECPATRRSRYATAGRAGVASEGVVGVEGMASNTGRVNGTLVGTENLLVKSADPAAVALVGWDTGRAYGERAKIMYDPSTGTDVSPLH